MSFRKASHVAVDVRWWVYEVESHLHDLGVHDTRQGVTQSSTSLRNARVPEKIPPLPPLSALVSASSELGRFWLACRNRRPVLNRAGLDSSATQQGSSTTAPIELEVHLRQAGMRCVVVVSDSVILNSIPAFSLFGAAVCVFQLNS